MLQTAEAVIDKSGHIRLLERVSLPTMRRALVTILESEAISDIPETALLSEAALAEDWNRPEEGQARSHLQPAQLS